MASIALSKALGNVENYMKKGNQGLGNQQAEILNDLVAIQDALMVHGARIKNISRVRQLVSQLHDQVFSPQEENEE